MKVGGHVKIPIGLASKYRSEERVGISTPDEVITRHHQKNIWDHVDEEEEDAAIQVAEIFGSDVEFRGPLYIEKEGRLVHVKGSVDINERETHIICLSRVLSVEIAREFEKEAVIEISDPISLFDDFSKQLKQHGTFDNLQYTRTLKRNEFLKSVEDSWMHEARMSWELKGVYTEIFVDVPEGAARSIEIESIGNPAILSKIPFVDFDKIDRMEQEILELGQLAAFAKYGRSINTRFGSGIFLRDRKTLT